VNDFAQQIRGVTGQIERPQRQQLMRLLVQIQLSIPSIHPTPAATARTAAPARGPQIDPCPAKTVCVPSVVVEGELFRMREARNSGANRLTSN